MPNLTRWDPLRELNNLRENMNRILEEGFATVSGSNIALDMYETEDAIVIETNPLPGVRAEDVEVSITGNVLTIHGETREEQEKPSLPINYLRKERRFGSFSRSITIPRAVKAEETVASFKSGVLTIIIPKAEEAKPKVIDVRSTESQEE